MSSCSWASNEDDVSEFEISCLYCRRVNEIIAMFSGDTSETASMVSGEFSQPSSLSEPLLTLATTVRLIIEFTISHSLITVCLR